MNPDQLDPETQRLIDELLSQPAAWGLRRGSMDHRVDPDTAPLQYGPPRLRVTPPPGWRPFPPSADETNEAGEAYARERAEMVRNRPNEELIVVDRPREPPWVPPRPYPPPPAGMLSPLPPPTSTATPPRPEPGLLQALLQRLRSGM